MSWVTFIWSLTAGICLTLGAVHFLVWTRRREEWANLVFSITAAAAAGYAVLDMLALHAQTPAEYGELWRWALLLGMLEGVLIAWFIRLYLRAGRLWLLGLLCGVRALMLVLNFVPGANFYFREITSLQQVPLLGEMISRPVGVLHPWVLLMPPSLLLIIVFALDAARTASRRDGHRRAWLLGGLMAGGFALALVCYALYARGTLPSTFSSQLFLLLIVLMGYELSLDVLRAAQLSRDLSASEQRLKLSADAAKLALWEWDIAADDIWVSDNGRELYGVERGTKIDFRRFASTLHENDRPMVKQRLDEAIAGPHPFVVEYRVVLPDGTVRWIAASGRVERNGQGHARLLRGVSLDITERKHAEQEAQQHRNEVAHLSRVTTLGEISGSLAHELNQPLGAILANAEAAELHLQNEAPDLGELRSILADIRKDDIRAGEIIHGMRAFLRRRELEMQPLAVETLVEDAARLLTGDAMARKTAVEMQIAPDLPHVSGDRVHLQQVLVNLIVNGMDAMNSCLPEDRKLTVTATQRDASNVEIAVSDAGTGVPATDLSRVFEAFHTTKRGGLGLGLAICRSVIEAHGGAITVENNAGRGATARFSLRVAQREE